MPTTLSSGVALTHVLNLI